MPIISATELDKIKHIQLRALIFVSFLASYGVIYSYFVHYGFSISGVLFLLLPFAVYVAKPETQSYRYALPALLTLVAFAFTDIELLLFLALGLTCFFVIESKLGKLNISAPIILLIAIPRIGYVFDLFGFPIRLKFTLLVSNILQLIGLSNTTQGNLIMIDNQVFTVDMLCMGLYMMALGLFVIFLMLAYFEKKHEVFVEFWHILGLIILASLGIILANLIRVLLLIILQIHETNPVYEWIGLGSLFFVVTLPAFIFIRDKVHYQSKAIPMFPKSSPWLRREIKMSMNGPLILGLLITNIKLVHFQENESVKTNHIEPLGYEILELPNRILQLSSARSLVYIKQQDAYQLSNHTPLQCWKTDGYEIVYKNLIKIDNQDVFFVEMKLGGQKYYGAW